MGAHIAWRLERVHNEGARYTCCLDGKHHRDGDKFYEDKSWNMFASDSKHQSSYGALGAQIPGHRRATPKLHGVKDFAFSEKEMPSGASILSYNNQKQVSEGRNPTRYLENTNDEDAPRYRAIVDPHFRSMPGQFKGRSVYQRYAKQVARKADRQLNKLANSGVHDEEEEDDGVSMA